MVCCGAVVNKKKRDENMKLEDFDQKIKAVARRFSNNAHEREDLEQTARMNVWRVLEKNPDVSNQYVYKVVEYSIRKVKRFERAKKRNGGKKSESFHRLEEDGFAPEDFLGENPDLTISEKVEFLKCFLKERFGRPYLEKIKEKHGNLPTRIVRGLVEEVWKLEHEEIPQKVSYNLFVESRMDRFLWVFYRNSPMKAIQEAYPDSFFEWEFNRVPNGFWNGEEGFKRAKEATRWLCEKCSVTGEEKSLPIGYEEFDEKGLGAMLHVQFNDSPFLALKSVFPNLREWQAKQIRKGFYDNPENRKRALDEFLLDLRMIPFSQLNAGEVYDENPRRIRTGQLEDFGLRGLIARYKDSKFKLFESVYPGRVYQWFFFGERGGDIKEIASKAIRWLFDTYLQIPKTEIPHYATNKLFWRMGFSGILTRRDLGLSSSTYAAVDLAYPGEFDEGQFRRYKFKKYIPDLNDFRSKGLKDTRFHKL